jgi:hypothetical protein
MLLQVGSVAAGFTLSLAPARLDRSGGRMLTALVVGASFALVAWPVAGRHAAALAAASVLAGLVVRLTIGAALPRAARHG